MADNKLPPASISGASVDIRAERRAFLKRSALVGVPLVLATVHGRSVLAQTMEAPPSGCASINPSGWRARNPELAQQCPETVVGEEQPLEQLAPEPEPIVDLTPDKPKKPKKN